MLYEVGKVAPTAVSETVYFFWIVEVFKRAKVTPSI